MTANITLGAEIPPPLATDADTATHPLGPCSICQKGVLRGQHYALTYPSGHLAHVACVARRATPPAGGTHDRGNPGRRNIMASGTNT